MADDSHTRPGEARNAFVAVIVCGVLVVLVVGPLCLLGIQYAHDTRGAITDALFEEHALPPVSTEAWAKLRVGMTKEEVQRILGEPGQRGQISLTVNGKEHKGPEYWEYGWHEAWTLMGGPSDKAHVVHFDQTGQVESFRAPLEEPGGDRNCPGASSARAETEPEH